MLHASRFVRAGLLQNITLGLGKNNIFTSLWKKPETRDERVKEYIPDVLEESFAEQRAVKQESTSRDVIVHLGHCVLRDIENKSPTPSISPNLTRILAECGVHDVIMQRPLSYLLYPSSSFALSLSSEQPQELIVNFIDNFRAMIEEVERSGGTIQRKRPVTCTATASATHSVQLLGSKIATKNAETSPASGVDGSDSHADVTQAPTTEGLPVSSSSSSSVSGEIIMSNESTHESMDTTMFVKVLSAMSLANLRCGDVRNAVRCVDAALEHAKHTQRRGGLFGLKAGLLVHQRKLEDAVGCAMRAIELSDNIQGYLHAVYALRLLHREDEAVKLLEQGCSCHPMHQGLADMLDSVRKEVKPALPASSTASTADRNADRGNPRLKSSLSG